MSSAVAPHPIFETGAGLVNLLVVSSSPDLRQDLLTRLESSHWLVSEASSGAEALEKIDVGQTSLVVLDPGLPDLTIDDFKAILNLQHPAITVIPINPHTGQPIIATPEPDSLSFEVVRRIEQRSAFRPKSISIPSLIVDEGERVPEGLPGFVGMSASVQRLNHMVRMVAQRETTVLIEGESGTGKDVVARAIHQLSNRRSKPFVVVNCAAIPETLLEAELFGFVKGAFTGAVQSNIGRIHAAQGGTLFLDEIGDLPLGLQSKLLRFLEQGEVQRLGSTDAFRVDVRLIAATNANLRRRVQERNFREDVYYRLSIFPIELAPLRERMEDLLLLTDHFIRKFCPNNVAFSPEAMDLLQQHTWPGNVRELRNVIERASILVGRNCEIRPEQIVI